jgi:arginine decarboxylase
VPALIPRDAFFARQEVVSIEMAVDRICAELVCPYPPGIPVLIPGEVVTRAAISYLQNILASGGDIAGSSDPELHTLRVLISPGNQKPSA